MSTELINRSAEHLCTNLAGYAQQGKETNIWRDFGRMTMDVVGSVAFGWDAASGSDSVLLWGYSRLWFLMPPSHAPHPEGLHYRRASEPQELQS